MTDHREHRLFTANALARTALLAGALTVTACTNLSPGGAASPLPEQPAATEKAKASEAPRVYSNDQDAVGALRSERIRVLVWNVQKAGSDQWIGDFRTLAEGSDLVLLQEARMHDEFSHGIASLPRWDMVSAWQWRDTPTGVLTASDAKPLSVRALGHREPLIRTNKSALVTEYGIAGSNKTLLVANIHAINFTIDTRAFRRQLIAVADLLDEHDGPVILSGDLNTWRGERHAIVDEIADALGLRAVAFDGPRKQFRQLPLDHVFYRDLELLDAGVTAVDSSDHNPLHVTFQYAPTHNMDTGSAMAAVAPAYATAGEQ
jgi:endonuclease/exonuclease/phosphatase (EEP) superfamily protein YafD